MLFAGFIHHTRSSSFTTDWSCIHAQQIEPGRTSGPWHNSRSRKLHIDAQLETSLLLFLIMYDQCRYGDMLGWSVTEQTSIHSYTSPYGSSYTLLFFCSRRSRAYSHPACHQDVIKAPTSLLRLVILSPPTEIPAFLYMLLLFGVVLLSISISDMGIWGVTACLAVEVVGEEMWRSRQCHLIRSWRRLSGGRAIVGRGFCGELAFMSTFYEFKWNMWFKNDGNVLWLFYFVRLSESI